MEKWRKVIAGVREFSPLIQMAEMGMSPERIKHTVVETLQPFFENQRIVAELAVPALVGEAVNAWVLERDPWALNLCRECVELHRRAQHVAGDESLRACAIWEPAICHGLREHWSAFHLQVPLDNLAIEEFRYAVLDNIGATIEAALNPHLRELLHQIRLRDGLASADLRLGAMTLGEVVAELADTSGLPELVAPPPWGVRLNHWRNIAKHHSSRIDGDTIVCWYGGKARLKEVRLTRDELHALAVRVLSLFRAVKLARTIFFVDNVENARTFLPDVDIPLEAELLNFSAAAASQGFEVMDARLTEQEASVTVRDVSDSDPEVRRFHAMQFVYPLWLHTGRARVVVEYQEKDGTPSLVTTAWAEDLDRIARGELAFSELANLTQLADLKTGHTARRPRTDAQQ
jgi:hypothetical protein